MSASLSGSVLTVQVVAQGPCRRGGDVLLMDADVLYDARIMQALAVARRRATASSSTAISRRGTNR